MGYNQGADNLERSITTASVTAGSSNGAASVTTEGNRFTISITLNGTLSADAKVGDITLNNSMIKSTSVIWATTQDTILLLPMAAHSVADGSCKFTLHNHTGGNITGNPTSVANFVIYN